VIIEQVTPFLLSSPLNKCTSGAEPCPEHSLWLQPLFARSAQANDGGIASSERILIKKPWLKSLLRTFDPCCSTFIQRGIDQLRFLRTDKTRYPRLDHALQGSPAGRIQWSLGTRLPFDASKGGSDNGPGLIPCGVFCRTAVLGCACSVDRAAKCSRLPSSALVSPLICYGARSKGGREDMLFQARIDFPGIRDTELYYCTVLGMDLSATAYRKSLRAALQGRCGTPVTSGRLELTH
jgi:hypothetical protein